MDEGRILGVVLAGGQSRRFGSDKALADVAGKPLIAHAVETLGAQVDVLAVCGRGWPGILRLDDDPEGGFGPLAGLNAALDYADHEGFSGVLAAPVDVYPLPGDLRDRLVGDAAAVFERQHLVSWWPVSARSALKAQIAAYDPTVRGLIARVGARRVAEPFPMRNINRPGDLG